jgi:hypothetical protein
VTGVRRRRARLLSGDLGPALSPRHSPKSDRYRGLSMCVWSYTRSFAGFLWRERESVAVFCPPVTPVLGNLWLKLNYSNTAREGRESINESRSRYLCQLCSSKGSIVISPYQAVP